MAEIFLIGKHEEDDKKEHFAFVLDSLESECLDTPYEALKFMEKIILDSCQEKNFTYEPDIETRQISISSEYGNQVYHLVRKNLSDFFNDFDFTINCWAMRIGVPQAEFLYFNSCKQDTELRVLNTPLDPLYSFKIEPIRILRCITYCVTKGLTLSDKIYEALDNPLALTILEDVTDYEVRLELLKPFYHNTWKTFTVLNSLPDRLLSNILKRNNFWLFPARKDGFIFDDL